MKRAKKKTKKPAAKKSAAKKSPAKKSPAKKSPEKKSAAKKSAAKKPAAKKPAAKKPAAKKPAGKKPVAKKSAAKKSAAKKPAAKKPATKTPVAKLAKPKSAAAPALSRDQFWEIVASGKGAPDRNAAVGARLDTLTPAQIVAYQEHFDRLVGEAYKWNLWGAAYLIEGGCSDDGFTDFRYGLIAAGKDVYEAALANPDSIPSDEVAPDELFGYLAGEAYTKKTGNDEMPRSEYFEGDLGERWDFEDAAENQRRLPRLWAKHGNGNTPGTSATE